MPVLFKATLLQGRSGTGHGGYYMPSQLLSLTKRLGSWKQFWTVVFIPRYLELVQQNFETEGELSGYVSGWPDLEPAYAAWKARHFPGRKILERTRRLRESLAPGASKTEQLLQAGPRELRIGTRVYYGRFVVARRPFLPRVVMKEWTPLFRDWIRNHMVEVGIEPDQPVQNRVRTTAERFADFLAEEARGDFDNDE